MGDDDRFVVSSGNVYEDLGFDDPDSERAKADLAIEIVKVIRARNLTQQQAADLMGIRQPKVSRIVRGRLDGISQDALIDYLRNLGQDVQVTVTPATATSEATPPSRGALTVQGYEYGERCESPMAASTSRHENVRFD